LPSYNGEDQEKEIHHPPNFAGWKLWNFYYHVLVSERVNSSRRDFFVHRIMSTNVAFNHQFPFRLFNFDIIGIVFLDESLRPDYMLWM